MSRRYLKIQSQHRMNKQPTIHQLMDELSDLKETYRVNTQSQIADATAAINRRLTELNREGNRLREERASVATQLYAFGIFLDSDGIVKSLNATSR